MDEAAANILATQSSQLPPTAAITATILPSQGRSATQLPGATESETEEGKRVCIATEKWACMKISP